MSELAEQQRASRRSWAAAGSSHDRLIGALRVVLPMAVGVLTAFLALAPLTVGRDISFVLSKNHVDVAGERMRVIRAVYRGADSQGQPFELDAASAVQASSRDPIVKLTTLNARIQLTSGPATIVGGHGRYDMDNQHVAIDGPVKFDDAAGNHILTSNVLVDMSDKLMESRGPVAGTMNLGNYRADRLHANLDSRVIDLVGNVHLHIAQGGARRRR